MAEGGESFPLARADGAKIGGFSLVLSDVRQMRKSGWRGFTLLLEDAAGIRGSLPVVRGICSRGGKDGVRPWMDIDFWEDVPFEEGSRAGTLVSLRKEGADRELFRILGEAIPPGGHLMVSYEGDQPIHEETLLGLSAGIPPVATPLGHLLFLSGFACIKDWYLAEGGMEGPRKLWGEKAPDAGWEKTFRERTLKELMQYLARSRADETDDPHRAARERAEEMREMIGFFLHPPK
jgi:hypothetical protein